MKKIFTFAALLFAAVSVNAAIIEMTCAEAKQYALDSLQSGDTGTDSVSVTGYVTNTNGTVSRGQQTFWLDDVKGSVKTFQAYWCNLPDSIALNVGDKVTIKGLLMNYNGTTAEMKNGDTEVLERVVIKRDTIESTVCDVIEEGEALNDQEITDDFFTVEGVVASVKTPMNQYKQESFWMECDSARQLQAYNLFMEDSIAAEVGDSVFVFGKIQKYGTTIEMIAGYAKVIAKGQVQVDTITVNVAQAVEAGMKLENGKTSVDVYIVEGYADSIAYAFDSTKLNMSFYMCDDLANPSYEFEAYKASTDMAVTVGDKVKIMGNLYHYYKAAVEDAEHPENNKPEVDLIEISNGKVLSIEPAEQGIENIVLTEKAQKVVVDGVVYIIRDNKMYNTLGVQVR